MLSRQRSTCFLLDPPHVQGSDFVEMLRLIAYPGASGLKGEDFDWLSEGNEEAEMFLGWLCGVVDQRNVMTDEQLEAYNALRLSGKPLLEVEELQNLCGKEGVGDHEDDDDEDDDMELEERKSLAELEAEVQSLKNLRSHRLRTRNKLESLGLTLLYSHLSLEKSQKEQEKNLIQTEEVLSAMNCSSNILLDRLRELMKELEVLHTPSDAPRVFISSLDLARYIRIEDTCWDQVEHLSMELFPDRNEDQERRIATQQEVDVEGERIRTSWASQRGQLSQALGTLHGKEQALNWVLRTKDEQSWDPQEIPLLEQEIQTLEVEIDTLRTQKLPTLVCESSMGSWLASHNKLLQLEKRRQKEVEQCQIPLKEAAISQLARLQLLEMGLHAELKDHRQTEKSLLFLKSEMVNRAAEMERRLKTHRDHHISSLKLIPVRISSKDHTAVRLTGMLCDPTERKELFPKYEDARIKAITMTEELQSLKLVLQRPLQQIHILEMECDDFQHSLFRGTRSLQLRDPTLKHCFESLCSSVSQFNQWCLDCLRDLEKKKLSIQTSRLEQERKLYVFFYQDTALLASTVQELEQRARELESK
ncbi:HAUS augmin-like complex subunit 3 [Pelodytes ibericus]